MRLIYTYTDEAPALATESLLPILTAFAGAAGIEVEQRDISLAGTGARALPRSADRRAARRRRAGRARRAGPHRRGQHRQAAQHQRVASAAQGGHRRTAEPGVCDPRLRGRAVHRCRARGSGPLRPGQGKRGQPGPARGELRPPGARVGQGLRAGAPALDGRLVLGVALARRHHDRRRLPRHRAVGHHAGGRRRADRARGRRRRRDRAAPARAGAGRRGHRRRGDARRRARRLLRTPRSRTRASRTSSSPCTSRRR